MLGPLARITNAARRNVLTKFVRNHGGPGDYGGVPGENMPFDISNRYKLTAIFIAYVGSGLSAPFLIVRYHIIKNNRV